MFLAVRHVTVMCVTNDSTNRSKINSEFCCNLCAAESGLQNTLFILDLIILPFSDMFNLFTAFRAVNWISNSILELYPKTVQATVILHRFKETGKSEFNCYCMQAFYDVKLPCRFGIIICCWRWKPFIVCYFNAPTLTCCSIIFRQPSDC